MSGRFNLHSFVMNRVEFKAFRLINSPPQTDCLDSLSQRRIFMLTALLNLLTACLHTSCAFAAQGFLFPLIPILFIFLMQELTSILTLSFLTLVNSETLFLCLFFPPAYDKLFQKRSVKILLTLNWTSMLQFLMLFSLQGLVISGIFFSNYFCLSLPSYLIKGVLAKGQQ